MVVTADTTSRTATVVTPRLSAKIDPSGAITVLIHRGRDLINGRTGCHYSRAGRRWAPTELLVARKPSRANLAWRGKAGELHYVFMDDLDGFYSYFVVGDMAEEQVVEMRTLYRVTPNLFPQTFTMAMGPARTPPPAHIDVRRAIQDNTFPTRDGTCYTKYDSCDFLGRDLVHGVFGPQHGLWVIPVSREAYNGGPTKQELLVHVEPFKDEMVVLNMLHGSHFGNPPGRLPKGKFYGPWLVYLNDGSWADALDRARAEEASCPYGWVIHEHYPRQRATVTGRLRLANDRSTAGTVVVLAEPLPDGDLSAIVSSYWYSGRCNEDGFFRIPQV